MSAGELGLAEPDETGNDLRSNAAIKALAAAQATKLPAFADDSGLVVDALGGAPGIYSARWAGPRQGFLPRRWRRSSACCRSAARPRPTSARRISSPRSASPGPTAICEEFEARVDGTLVWPPRGDAGFGYDPMFLPDGHDRTFGEMTSTRSTACRRAVTACRIAPAPS